MTLPRRLVLRAAGAAALTFAPFGGGQVVRAATPDPLAPWDAAPAAAAHPDPRVRALAWAVLAPNPHNRQPWIAELPAAMPEIVVLRCDLDRRLPVTDPFDRQITIGLGAFAELFRLAAAETGRAATLVPFPEGEPAPRLDARPVALLRLGAPGSAVPDPLFTHAGRRRSTKRPFDMDRPVPDAAFATLADAVAAPVRFGGTGAPMQVAALREIAWRAWQVEAGDPAAHGESVALMRLGRAAVATSPDGISVWGPGLEEAIAAGQVTRDSMLPGGAGYRVMIERYTAMLAATPAYLWLTTDGNDRAAQLAAGRDWLRVNLAATALGLALHPVSQALQEFDAMRGPYREIHAALAPGGGTVQMLGRLGYAAPVPPTPRWPVESRMRVV
ncbi:Acg family FMN-binding oxidoreductase [Roseomonas sp. AR75]|uniref:Acg family FMN-binding oxidoreductase n=1 Tax=Roseomonas sp. AR75 TaxID=2562311 RepID=UPI0010C0B9BC|nr:twin-arginine translocation pathway signal protein [Roseomonas sp. AR75]